jgi:hypothetical protein
MILMLRNLGTGCLHSTLTEDTVFIFACARVFVFEPRRLEDTVFIFASVLVFVFEPRFLDPEE